MKALKFIYISFLIQVFCTAICFSYNIQIRKLNDRFDSYIREFFDQWREGKNRKKGYCY
jgi:hypothetical protein